MSDIKRSEEAAGRLRERLEDKLSQTKNAIEDAKKNIEALPKPDNELTPLTARPAEPEKPDKKTADLESWRLESELLRLDELEQKRRFLEQKQKNLKLKKPDDKK